MAALNPRRPPSARNSARFVTGATEALNEASNSAVRNISARVMTNPEVNKAVVVRSKAAIVRDRRNRLSRRLRARLVLRRVAKEADGVVGVVAVGVVRGAHRRVPHVLPRRTRPTALPKVKCR